MKEDKNPLFKKSPNKYKNKNSIYIGGYDENLVINKNYLLSLDTIYKCNICYKIMINPVECENCGHNFCYNCINSSDCPFGCTDNKIKESSLAIKNLLSPIFKSKMNSFFFSGEACVIRLTCSGATFVAQPMIMQSFPFGLTTSIILSFGNSTTK